MRCFIVDSFAGFFAYDESLRLILARTFDGPETAASQLLDIERSGISNELEILIHDLMDMGFDSFIFEDEQEGKVIKRKFGVEIQVISPSEGGRAFRASPISAVLSSGGKADITERLLRGVADAMVKVRVKSASAKRDRLVAQAVSALDEIDKNVNITVSRVREWYGLHFPELDSLVPDHKQYMAIVNKFGKKTNLELEGVTAIVQNENKAEAICDSALKSMGADIAEPDLRQIIDLAEVNLKTYASRDAMDHYIDETMKEVAPNLRELAGAGLGARLIALCGSLEGLAKKPASTIQVLGAEKALFRSLKTGARPPKHGIIFQHQYLHSAERWQRGKIARALAGKLSIAARVDAFGGEYIADNLKASVDKRIAEIKKKYSKPPAREKPQFERRERFGRDRFRGRERFSRDKFRGRERFSKDRDRNRGNKRW